MLLKCVRDSIININEKNDYYDCTQNSDPYIIHLISKRFFKEGLNVNLE